MLKFLIFTIAAIIFANGVYASVFRVNNSLSTDAGQKLYKTIQEANDDPAVVLAGDTLMIEGAATEYTNATISKKLVLIGPGYFLSENPQTQASPLKAVVRNITLDAGSTGSILMGLTFSNNSSAYTPYIKVNNVIVMRCYMPNAISLIGNLDNIQIIENFFVSTAIVVSSSSYTFTGVTLRNNYIGGNLSITSDDSFQRVFAAVEYNIFLGNIAITTSIFRSNIIVKITATVNVLSNSIQNNLVSNGQLPATNGNQTYSVANLFVGATGNSTDGQYKIKSNSPYLTAGYNNTQPGIFGGSQSYVLSGMPAIPSVYEFTANGFANQQTGLPINIKVKANQ